MSPATAACSTLKQTLLDANDVSTWLKQAITELDQRDPCDALRDAELLVDLQQRRWQALISQAATA